MPPARARILVAEDQAAVAQQIINRFTLLGHEVRWAKAVREVRAELSSFQPDVLILDATLDTDGMTVDEQLAEIQRRAIDLTARQMRAFRAIVERLGDL